MITINLYKDGAYVKGHDIPELCTLVSYAMYSCMNDCYEEDTDLYYYESINDKQWSRLGLTYFKINLDSEGHLKVFGRFKRNIMEWITALFPERIKIIEKPDEEINWEDALADAKQEQGL